MKIQFTCNQKQTNKPRIAKKKGAAVTAPKVNNELSTLRITKLWKI